jgi:hypothetical protein
MRMLTATGQGQGERHSDFNWCIEGELVMPPQRVCQADRDNPDGRCGCGRSFCGLASHKATTTAVVRDLPEVTEAEYVAAIRCSLDDQGWDPDWAEELANDLLAIADELPLDVVLECRLGVIQVRQLNAPH